MLVPEFQEDVRGSEQTRNINLLSPRPDAAVSPNSELGFHLLDARKVPLNLFRARQSFIRFFKAVQQTKRLSRLGLHRGLLFLVPRFDPGQNVETPLAVLLQAHLAKED